MQPLSALGAPVVVIGAGPVGLAAAARCIERGLPVVVLEAGEGVASHVRSWSHVRLFSPWRFNIDAASRSLLVDDGWDPPAPDEHPTGGEIVERYLGPLASTDPISSVVRLRHRVVGVTHSPGGAGATDARSSGRFVVHVDTPRGRRRFDADAIVDASGTWGTPNPLGRDGVSAPGEADHAARIAYGIADVAGQQRHRYTHRRVAVVGSGHSAQNVLIDLATRNVNPASITWIVRNTNGARLFGGGEADGLPERGRLGTRVRELVDADAVEIVADFTTAAVTGVDDAVVLVGDDGRNLGPFDEIVAATGSRPDLQMLRALRLSLDPIVEAPVRLAPLIDPSLHSCGSVPPHGAIELGHPDDNVYLVGAKSYGRAPTFLLATGYEQVRSVVARLAGDHAAAEAVELVLPETGVCFTDDLPTRVGHATGPLPVLDAAGTAVSEGCCA